MKKIFATIILIFSAAATSLAQDASLTEQANKAYTKDDFESAINLYLEAEKADGASSDLYYNIANAYYRLGSNGKAILYYERAIRLNPSNKDARTNLDFVSNSLKIDKDNGESYMSDLVKTFIHSHSANGWATFAAIMFILAIAGVACYVFVDAVALRKVGFFGALATVILSAAAIYCSYNVKSYMTSHNEAVVMKPSVTLSTSPRTPKDKSEEAFLLSEGVVVTIIDEVTNSDTGSDVKWFEVTTVDNHRAWISEDDIEII